jgi:tetratricopeptide (TPR) repeat protein
MKTPLLRRLRVATCLCALYGALAPGAALGQSPAGTNELTRMIERGDYEVAIERARSATTREPAHASLWNTLGHASFAVGELDAAQQAFERASALQGAGRLEAMLNLGLVLQYRGKNERAAEWFARVLEQHKTKARSSTLELAAVARAAQELGIGEPGLYRDAVRLYGEALAADAANTAARVTLGELLLAKYNNTEATEVFREALARDSTSAAALLGLARSQYFDHAEDASQTARASLDQNPNYTPARAFLARLFIESEQFEDAEREATRALQLNPNSLESLAVLASVYFLTDNKPRFKATVARCLSINARYAELYNTLAELSVQNRLYHEAVGFAQQAIELDPHSWRAYGLLGLNQLRIGDMQAARANLERAFAGDPFNVWTKNTLDLMDTFGEYETIRQGHFVLVLHRNEAGLLAPYLGALAQEAYARYAKQYAYEPPVPIRIELYPSHADFSVRTVGLAGIGILGVSFGPVVALDSPSARTGTTGNWGSTVWHELAHTFHLGMTRNRVPRWFTEGLAVYEEQRAREGWGSDVTPAFLKAYRDGNVYPVSELNNGFVRPRYPEEVLHSYYLASLVFAFIDQRWGFAVIARMLNAYGGGKSTAEVFQSVLNVNMSDFDTAFDEYVRARFARALAALPARAGAEASGKDAADNDFELQMRAGVEALAIQDDTQAEAHLLRAQALFPEYAGNDSAYWLLAELYAKRREHAKAAAQLRRMVAINAESYEAHMKLAGLYETLGDSSGAADALARAVYIYPFEPQLHEQLARLYEKMNNWPGAIREHAAVIALKPADMAQARYQLAYAYARAGQRQAARRELLQALELAPNYPEALELLLELRGFPSRSDAGGPSADADKRTIQTFEGKLT